MGCPLRRTLSSIFSSSKLRRPQSPSVPSAKLSGEGQYQPREAGFFEWRKRARPRPCHMPVRHGGWGRGETRTSPCGKTPCESQVLSHFAKIRKVVWKQRTTSACAACPYGGSWDREACHKPPLRLPQTGRFVENLGSSPSTAGAGTAGNRPGHRRESGLCGKDLISCCNLLPPCQACQGPRLPRRPLS